MHTSMPLLALLCSHFVLAASFSFATAPTQLTRGPALRRSSAAAMQTEVEEEYPEMTEEEYAAFEEAEKNVELSAEAKKVYRGMRSESGVEFAPWMQVDAEAIAKAEQMRKERKARAAAAAEAVDPLSIDPQAAELGAGGGLRSKVISEEEVELRWSTGNEEGNAGFIVQRRKGGTEKFEDIASFDKFAVLKTKGSAGGAYTFLDDEVPSVGTWVYRVLDCDTKGARTAVCQKLVEVDSQSEQTFTLVVGGVIALLAVGLVVAGISADPIQTTSAGRNVGLF